MKRFNKSYELSVFLMLFVLVIDGIRGDKSNRIDAEQEPFETVTLADGARSTLFGSCLATSRTLDATLYSIEISDGTNEFIRYVPDSSQLTESPEWKTVARNPPVTDITDCAEAAHSGGNPMFKYSGGDDCKVSKRSYDLNYQPDCDAKEQDAVFISSSTEVICLLPKRTMLVTKEGEYFCIVTVNIGPMSYEAAKKFCSVRKSSFYEGPIGLSRFDDFLKILKDLKVESGNFLVAANSAGAGTWRWISDAENIDPALMVSPPSREMTDIVFINGTAGGKLDFAQPKNYMGGVVCLASFLSP